MNETRTGCPIEFHLGSLSVLNIDNLSISIVEKLLLGGPRCKLLRAGLPHAYTCHRLRRTSCNQVYEVHKLFLCFSELFRLSQSFSRLQTQEKNSTPKDLSPCLCIISRRFLICPSINYLKNSLHLSVLRFVRHAFYSLFQFRCSIASFSSVSCSIKTKG